MPAAHVAAPFYSDSPIAEPAADKLDRERFAVALASQVVEAEASEGFVVGITGPWGSGKTSLLNLVAKEVDRSAAALVLRFNPWLFTGTEELVSRYLSELVAGLEAEHSRIKRLVSARTFRRAAGAVRDYANVVRPYGGLVGTAAAITAGAASQVAARGQTAAQAREAARAALRALGRRVVVIVDDLDRLEDDQIREVVRLVKLVGDFPNTVYLLAYDAEVVARAVSTPHSDDGRAYLEKIVQAEHPLPQMPEWLLREELLNALDAIYSSFESGRLGPVNEQRWINLFQVGIRPVITRTRDVHRFANSLPVVLASIGDEVAFEDVVALEALRMFVPKVWIEIPALFEQLRDARSSGISRPDPIEQLVDRAGRFKQPSTEILEELFRRNTAGARAERRVADRSTLYVYLEHTRPASVSPASAVTRALELSSDPEAFASYLETFSPAMTEDILARLDDFRDEFDVAHASEFIASVVNQLPRLREETRGFFEEQPEIVVIRLALRILERVPEQERLEVVERALPMIGQYSGRIELLFAVGHRENVGLGLVPDAEGQVLLASSLDDAIDQPASVLSKERFLWDIFYRRFELSPDDTRQRIAALVANDEVFVRLLRSRLSYRKRAAMGQAAVILEPALPWDTLLKMVGADVMTARLNEIEEAQLEDERDRNAVETARRYLAGELPSEPFR